MRNTIVRCGLAITLLLLGLSGLVMSTEDDMVFVDLFIALVATIPLLLATQASHRRLAWLMTVVAIILALNNWRIGVERLRKRNRDLLDQIAHEQPRPGQSSSGAARTATE